MLAMAQPLPHPETMVARIPAERLCAQRMADGLAELLDPDTHAVSVFEDGDIWTVEVVFHDEDERTLIADLVAQIGGREAAGKLTFSTVGVRDWVAASLEGLSPVRAGRFVIHGSHDRSRVLPNQIGRASCRERV